MTLLRPISSDPIAIRQALERGWATFASCPWVLMGFTLVGAGQFAQPGAVPLRK